MDILDWFVDLAKHGHDLAHAVGAIVEEERIVILDTSLVAIGDDRL